MSSFRSSVQVTHADFVPDAENVRVLGVKSDPYGFCRGADQSGTQDGRFSMDFGNDRARGDQLALILSKL
jgi:hypothetical protein